MMSVRFAEWHETDVCADILREAWRGMWFVPQDLHTPAEDRQWMRDVFIHQVVWVALAAPDPAKGDQGEDRRPVGFLSMAAGTIHNLYIRPAHQARGLGHALIETAKASSDGQLRLWVFEPNKGAIRFYKRHGFLTICKTDGQDNEEKVPDRLMAWQRHAWGEV